MKVRLGFVSNSSSSSFTLVLTKQDYDEIVDALPGAFKREILKCKPAKGKVGEIEVVMVSSITGSYASGAGCIAIFNDHDLHWKRDEEYVYQDFIEALEKKAVVTSSLDM